MKRISIGCACVLIALQCSLLRGADPDDLTSDAVIQPVIWEPMITELYAANSKWFSSVTTAVAPVVDPIDPASEVVEWTEVKRLASPRKDAYGEREAPLCAWIRVVNNDGTVNFRAYSTTPDPDPQAGGGAADAAGPRVARIHCVHLADGKIKLDLGFDIAMNRDMKTRDELVKKYFKLLELSVTAVKVSDDPLGFREPVPTDAKEVSIVRIGNENHPAGEDFSAIARRFARGGSASITWDTQLVGAPRGVIEFRVKARVQGRVNELEEPISKSVDGCIRVAIVDDARLEVVKIPPLKLTKYSQPQGP